ncbi:MAG TPA: hypothetical protein VMW24_24275 [Sedimentisphaerales bacterium]|nr:hypothetical protein [Sedimentisphaerales bacterium]
MKTETETNVYLKMPLAQVKADALYGGSCSVAGARPGRSGFGARAHGRRNSTKGGR